MAAKAAESIPTSADSFLDKNVFDLFSLKGRTVAITGGARGIGLALGFAVAEAGGSVAILDAAEQPHEHFKRLQSIASKAEYYRYVSGSPADESERLWMSCWWELLVRSDVTDYEMLQSTFADIVKDFGRVDGLYAAM
jgi:sorbose reductase